MPVRLQPVKVTTSRDAVSCKVGKETKSNDWRLAKGRDENLGVSQWFVMVGTGVKLDLTEF